MTFFIIFFERRAYKIFQLQLYLVPNFFQSLSNNTHKLKQCVTNPSIVHYIKTLSPLMISMFSWLIFDSTVQGCTHVYRW